MNFKNLFTFGIFSIIFGLCSTEYAPSVSDEIQEQQNEQNQLQQHPKLQQQQQQRKPFDFLHQYQNNENIQDDDNNDSIDDDNDDAQHQKNHKGQISLDESILIMSSSSLDHNKTEFKTKSDERTTHEFSTLASGSSLTTTEFISQQSNKIRNDLKSESNFNNNLHSNSTLIPNTTTTDESTTSAAITTATARPHSKSRKFRGKRKKIKKRFNKKNKLKYDLEETEENVEEKIENNYNSNKNHKNNNQKNKKFYNIKRKNRIHEIELEANIENPYSSIELLSESSSSTAADADALALNQHETKKSLVFKNKKLRKSQHRTQRKNQKKRNKEHLHHRWNDDDILDNHHDQYYYTNTERRTKLSNSNSKSRNSNINTDNIRKNSNNSRNKFNYNTTTTITSLSPTSIDFKSHQKNNRKMQIDSLYNDFNSQIHSHQSHHHPKKLHHNQYNNQKRYQQNHFQHHNQQNIVDNNPRDKVNAFNLINYNNLNNNDNDEDININDDIIDDDDDDYDDDIDNDDDGLQHQRKRTKTKFKDIINIDIDADIIDETNENIHDNNDDNMDDDNNNDDDDDDVYYNPEIIDETKSMQINKNLRNFKTKNNKNYNKYNKKNINYNKNEMKNLRRDAGKLLEKKQRKEKKFQNRYERGGDEKHQQKYNQKNYKKTENRNLDYVDEKQQSDWQQYHEHQQKLSKNEKNQNQDNFKDIQFSKDNLIELSSRPSSFLMIKSAHKKISLDNGNMQDDDDNTDSNDSSDDDNNDGYIDNIDSFDISASADESNQNSNEKSVNLNTNDGIQNHIYSIRNQKQKQQQRLKLQQQQQQQQQQFKQSKPIDDINQSVVSTLNHYSIQSQEEQLMTMMEKTNPRQKLNNINQQKSPTSTFQSQSQSQSQSSSSSSGYQTSNTTSTEQNKEQKNYWNVIGLNRLTTNNNDFTNTNTVNQSQNNFADESNSNSNGIEKKFYMNVNKDDRNNLHNRKNGNDESYNISGGGGGSSSSSTGISNGNSISENLSQEDFITSKHSVEKLMEITSIEKDIDENETGDLSCFQDDDFQPAPEIPHADIKYLRNEEKGFENSFLEVEYICHHGYELQIANTDDINSNEKHRNVFCKNNNWIGTPPFCVKMVKDNNNNSNNKNGRNQQGIDERNQSKSNRTCNNPEKCEHLCVVENDIEKCVCHKGFKLNNKHCEDINECVSRNGHGPCQDVCINTWGSYKCSCDNIPGSHLNTDGHTCMEIDECSQNNGGCSHTCIHTMGRAYCLCPEGYTLDKDWKTCVDIDECAEQASDDSSELRCEFGCINTPGSYTCLVDFGAEQSIYEESLTECADGFYHNSSTADCEDINECSEKNGGCLHRCINTFGSFYCSCLPGYHIDSDMKACIAAPTLNNKNLMNGIDVSCPPLFPPKHGYLECSRPLSENDNNNNNSDNDNSNIMTETNGDGNSHNNNKNTTENRNENSQINVENSNSNSGKNVSILDDVKNKEQQQQQLQQEQQSHLTTNRPGSQCVLRCPTGFRINGNFSKQCNTNGKWIGDSDGTCIRYPTPKLICPTDITLETPPNEKMAKLKIPRPRTDVNFDRDVSVTPEFLKTSSDIAFEIGTRNVTYTAKNPVSKLSISCSFTISVVEGESPTVKYCPGTQKYSLEKQHDSIKVIWKEPIFQDNINVTEISKTNTPGNNFGIGTHQIVYIAKDEAGYSARCIFKIIVNVPPQDVLIHPLPFYRMFYKK